MKRYLILLAMQSAVCFAVSLAAVLLKPIGWLYACITWAVLPAAGAISAFLLVKKGVNPYGAWILPAVMPTIAYLVLTRGLYLPNGWSMLLMAFVSLMGAAAGDVYKKRYLRRKNHK